MANPREEKPVLHTKKHLARLERERRQTNIILYYVYWITCYRRRSDWLRNFV